MSVSTLPSQQVVLEGISWKTYERVLSELENRQIRLTYDGGVLEIVTPSAEHEHTKKLLGRMIEVMTEELDVPIRSGGSTTWKRRSLAKGLEPDDCYWVARESQVRGRAIDVEAGPPPDLAIEIDVHARSLDRLPLYASLGIPEVWRWNQGWLSIHVLRDGGHYDVVETSSCFPWLPPGKFAAFLRRWPDTDETTWIRSFRAWVRGHLRQP